jgi:hypothetical protein
MSVPLRVRTRCDVEPEPIVWLPLDDFTNNTFRSTYSEDAMVSKLIILGSMTQGDRSSEGGFGKVRWSFQTAVL